MVYDMMFSTIVEGKLPICLADTPRGGAREELEELLQKRLLSRWCSHLMMCFELSPSFFSEGFQCVSVEKQQKYVRI